MTQGIISLGKAFPLDSLQRAILTRWFWQAGGQRFANPCPPARPAFSVGQNGPVIWQADFAPCRFLVGAHFEHQLGFGVVRVGNGHFVHSPLQIRKVIKTLGGLW